MRALIITAAAVAVVAAAAVPLVAVGVARGDTPTEPAAVAAPANAAAPAPALDKAAIGEIVREYLLANPEVLQEAYMALEAKQQAEQASMQASAIADKRDLIYNSTRQVVLGNPEGKVTMVEFFDYNCGYCKRALGDTLKLMKENPDLRIVLKEFPVLGQGSSEAAQVAIAVNAVAPERYLDFHTALLSSDGPHDRVAALATARELGLPLDKLQAAMEEPVVAETIEEVYGLATALGITGTPSYVVDDKVLVGAVGFETLKQGITDARDCSGTESC